MPEPYEPKEALEKIHFILQNDGDLLIRPHCYDRMDERTVDDLDIEKVLLENGIIQYKPEFDEKHQRWKYSVDGYDTEHEKLRVIVNIVERDWRVVAITVIGYWKEKKK